VHFRNIFALGLVFAAMVMTGFTQSVAPKPADEKPKKAETKKEQQPDAVPAAAKQDPKAPATAETVAESAIVIYGGFGGRQKLDQIRKTTIERGKMSLVNAQGATEPVSYEKWSIRGENLNSEKIRADLEYPSIKYALVRAEEKTFGLYNDTIFSPREDATKEFENRVFHGLEALLRYKENGSTLELAGHEKIMGVDFYFIDVTDKGGRKTRFYVSAKTYRVMMIDYEEDGIKYRRKFYNYNYAQGTLVPFRSTLTANDKLIEESEVLTVTYGQKVDEGLFKSGT
jgi:hypothetical protein